jgi:hypothetical protein
MNAITGAFRQWTPARTANPRQPTMCAHYR